MIDFTCEDSVESGLDHIVQLKDKGTRLCEEGCVFGDVFHVGPYDAVSPERLRCRHSPDWRKHALS